MRCPSRSEEHTSELQSRRDLVCRLLLEKKTRNRAGGAGHEGVGGVHRVVGWYEVGVYDRPGSADPEAGPSVVVHVGRIVFFFNDTAAPESYTLSPPRPLPD